MKLSYSPSSDQLKKQMLNKYSGINVYFDQLEDKIKEHPTDATEEKLVVEGRNVVTYKRSVKTGLFSGNFINSYLYLSLSYAIDKSGQIVVIGAYVHYYT